MTNFEIEQEFIKNLYRIYKEVNISKDLTLKQIAKAQSILKQIFSYHFDFSKIHNGEFSKKAICDIEYGFIVYKNCSIEIIIDTECSKILIFCQFIDDKSDDYHLFTLDDICKFEIKNNTLILL